MQLYIVNIHLQIGLVETKNNLQFILIALILLAFPKINFGQAPDLGTASGLSLFTANGAFTNFGASTNVTGNVGTNSGAFNAFPDGTVTGNIYLPGDTNAAQAAIDVDSAYSRLGRVSCIPYIGDTLGKDQVLTQGVYCLEGASAVSGNLILNGESDPNALFIFKINGALSTSKFANIIMINSASFSNVYWQVNGAFALGDSSVFRGTVVANGSINLLEGSSLEGRGLSRLGSITLHNNLVAIPSVIPLSITLVSFNAEKNHSKTSVDLNWQTASEFNSAYFLIERSTDGINFKTIGKLDAVGYSTQLLSYFFTDEESVLGINYYRLDQFDLNGAQAYSPVKAVSFSDAVLSVNIYPNPFNVQFTIYVEGIPSEQLRSGVQLQVFNSTGQMVFETTVNNEPETVSLSGASGIYFYNVVDNNKTIRSGKLISQQ